MGNIGLLTTLGLFGMLTSSWYSANIYWLPTLCQGPLNMHFNPHNKPTGSQIITITEETETANVEWKVHYTYITQAIVCDCRDRIWTHLLTTTLALSQFKGKKIRKMERIFQLFSPPPRSCHRSFFKTLVYVTTCLLTSCSRWHNQCSLIVKNPRIFLSCIDLNIWQSWLFNSIYGHKLAVFMICTFY